MTKEINQSYGIGDWVYYTEDGFEYLCVLAQTSGGNVQLIAIEKDSANRTSESSPICYEGGTHKKLSIYTINKLTKQGKATIEKVNVSIEITNHNS